MKQIQKRIVCRTINRDPIWSRFFLIKEIQERLHTHTNRLYGNFPEKDT